MLNGFIFLVTVTTFLPLYVKRGSSLKPNIEIVAFQNSIESNDKTITLILLDQGWEKPEGFNIRETAPTEDLIAFSD
jgi:hypothetical protein